MGNFIRFEDQCEKCSCYCENADSGEIVNPDSECSLEQKIWGNKPCDFFDHMDAAIDAKDELINRRTENE